MSSSPPSAPGHRRIPTTPSGSVVYGANSFPLPGGGISPLSCGAVLPFGEATSLINRKRSARSPPSHERSCHHRVLLRRLPDVIPDVVGRRTYPGELSRFIIAGCNNPRIYRGTVPVPSIAPAEVDGKAKAQKSKKRKTFAPTQGQIAAVLSKPLPGMFRPLSVIAYSITRTQQILCL